jgi:hypothetical protein
VQEWHGVRVAIMKVRWSNRDDEESDQGQSWWRNPERTDAREGTSKATGKHQRTQKQGLPEATTSEEREDIWQDLRENDQAGDREAKLPDLPSGFGK